LVEFGHKGMISRFKWSGYRENHSYVDK